MTFYTMFNTPLCEIILSGNDAGLSDLHLNTGLGKRVFKLSESWVRNDLFFEDTKNQIDEYFRGERTIFNIKMNPAGTDFQKKVWQELYKIPFGVVCSYKHIAIAIGNPNASRAVGMANSRNPIPLIVPCHRVIGSGGQMTGFAHGIEMKKNMIQFEKDVLIRKPD